MAGTGTESQADGSTSDADDDFEFCILCEGAETDMCVADELFSDGKLLPLCPYLPPGSNGPTYIMPTRSKPAASTAASGPPSDSSSASSSGSSSRCVSRSQSSDSASSSSEAPQRRLLSNSLLYAHPSPSPQLRWAVPRRSTGSAPPPPARGVLRLGVAGAPDMHLPRASETKSAAAVSRDGGSKSARLEQASAAAVSRDGASKSARLEQASAAAVSRDGGSKSSRLEQTSAAALSRDGTSKSARFEQASAAAVEKKIGLGLFSDILGCKCSPDAVEPMRLPPAPAKQSRKKDGVKSGLRRSRILHWLEELSIAKEKK